MEVFKVVGKETRLGSNYTLSINSGIDQLYIDEALDFVKQFPEYFPEYKIDTTVHSAVDSIGILAFNSEESARRFQNQYRELQNYSMIIKLDVDSNDILPEAKVNSGCQRLALIISGHGDMSPPEGTIFCKKVKVLN